MCVVQAMLPSGHSCVYIRAHVPLSLSLCLDHI